MSGLESITAVTTTNSATLSGRVPAENPQIDVGGPGFADMIAAGLKNVESKIDAANAKVRDFSLNEDIPIHEVTIALEEARMSVELALQVRTRLIEGYREIMNMQL